MTVPQKESFAREAQKWVVVEPLWMMGGWMFLIRLGRGEDTACSTSCVQTQAMDTSLAKALVACCSSTS